jgi:hypothetical protein
MLIKRNIVNKQQIRIAVTRVIEEAFEKLEEIRIARGGKLFPLVGKSEPCDSDYPIFINVPGNNYQYYLFSKSDSNITRIYDVHSGRFIKFLPSENLYLINNRIQEKLGAGGCLHRFVDYTKNFEEYSHLTIDHKHGIKCDNRLSEIERCSKEENLRRSHRTYMLSNGVSGTESQIIRYLEVNRYPNPKDVFLRLRDNKFVLGLYIVNFSSISQPQDPDKILESYLNPVLWSID